MTSFKNKRILVFGLGLHGGGVGTVTFLAKHGARITITDLRSRKELAPSIRTLSNIKGVRWVLGKHREKDFLSADIILKNPGIPPSSPYLQFSRDHDKPITSDMGIFFRLCPATIIGVTGTRGKSTTAYLIWLFLKTFFQKKIRGRKRRIFLGGNIRKSPLEFLGELTKDDIVVLELSSFQLHDLIHDTWLSKNDRRSPQIAVITNIMRDHLNWHGTMRAYIKAKRGIVRYQTPGDIVIANGLDPAVRQMLKGVRSRVRFPKLPPDWRNLIDEKLGEHYQSSVALAVAVVRRFGAPVPLLKKAFAGFRGLEGRQEHIALIRGIHFVNDTTATVPEAAIAAIKRFREKAGSRRLILIAGGSDKKLLFDEFAKIIARDVDVLILLPGTATKKILKDTRYKIQDTDKKNVVVKRAKTIQEAVTIAYRNAKRGDWIVLSPGAASFGLFLNEFDRGEQFRREVKGLKN